MVLRYVRMAASMSAQYALVVANTRAIAAGSYPFTVSTDALIALNGIFLTKAIVRSDTWAERSAIIVGGCAGSAAALWLARRMGL